MYHKKDKYLGREDLDASIDFVIRGTYNMEGVWKPAWAPQVNMCSFCQR